MTLKEVKDKVAQEIGFKDFQQLREAKDYSENLINVISNLWAIECLKEAAKRAKLQTVYSKKVGGKIILDPPIVSTQARMQSGSVVTVNAQSILSLIDEINKV